MSIALSSSLIQISTTLRSDDSRKSSKVNVVVHRTVRKRESVFSCAPSAVVRRLYAVGTNTRDDSRLPIDDYRTNSLVICGGADSCAEDAPTLRQFARRGAALLIDNRPGRRCPDTSAAAATRQSEPP